MKIFQIIVLLAISSCSHREGVDYKITEDRTYNLALMGGHGYFVPDYVPDYLPPNPAPNFTPPPQPTFTPKRPSADSYTEKTIK